MAFMMVGMLWLPAAAITVGGGALMVLGHWAWGVALFGLGVVFVVGTRFLLREAWAARPCDYQLDASELRILGGCAGGTRLRIADIDTDASGIRAVRDEDFSHDALELATNDGRRLVLARAIVHRDEMTAFLDVVRAAAGRPAREATRWIVGEDEVEAKVSEPAAAREQPAVEAVTIEIVRCPGCGAPQVPAATATVECPQCGARCAMPELLRERLASLETAQVLDARARRALRQVLAQPTSRAAFIAVTAMGVVAGGAWALAVVMFVRAMLTHTLDAELGWHAAWFPVPVGVMVVLLGWRWLVARQTVHAVMLGFGALAATTPGGPRGCHGCGGPLATAPDSLVVTCAYCGAANVLGVPLPRDLRSPRRTLAALKQALGERAKEKSATNTALAWVAPVAACMVVWSGRYVITPERADRYAIACDTGEQCRMYAIGDQYSDDARVDLLLAACRMGDGQGCLTLGASHYQGTLGLRPDPAAAMPWLERACALEAADACEIVAGLRAQAKQ